MKRKIGTIVAIIFVTLITSSTSVSGAVMYFNAIMEKGYGSAHTSSVAIAQYGYDGYLEAMCYTGQIVYRLQYYDKSINDFRVFPGSPRRLYDTGTYVGDIYWNVSGNAEIVRGEIISDSWWSIFDSGRVTLRIPY